MILLHLYSKENNWGCFRRPETDKTERISRGQTSRHLDINVVTSQAVTLATLGDVGTPVAFGGNYRYRTSRQIFVEGLQVIRCYYTDIIVVCIGGKTFDAKRTEYQHRKRNQNTGRMIAERGRSPETSYAEQAQFRKYS